MDYDWKRLAALQLLILLLAFASAPQVRAGYAYSVQQTSAYNVSGATVGSITAFTSSSAAQNTLSGSGSESKVGTGDTLESYTGPGADRPAENTFTPLGMRQLDYFRGDALVTLSPSALTTSNVAEGSVLNNGIGSGSGSWSLSVPLTLAATSAVTLSFNFSNQLTLTNSSGGNVAADFSYTFDIRNSSGSVVFTSSPTAVNQNASLGSAGTISNPASGSISITSGTLSAGTYTGTISGSEHVFINAVPEPSTFLLVGVGGMGMAIFALRRKRQATPR
jgi:hypothetical protein